MSRSWEWSLSKDSYFRGDACDTAIESIYSTMWQLHKKYRESRLSVECRRTAFCSLSGHLLALLWASTCTARLCWPMLQAYFISVSAARLSRLLCLFLQLLAA